MEWWLLLNSVGDIGRTHHQYQINLTRNKKNKKMTMILLYFSSLIILSRSQQEFTVTQVPTFTVGTFYPTRSSLNADQTEEAVCRPIIHHIDRDSPRFRSELVYNGNSKITFRTVDNHIMSSRMQFILDALEVLYSNTITILKAWTPYSDSQLLRNTSLHYEGKWLVS